MEKRQLNLWAACKHSQGDPPRMCWDCFKQALREEGGEPRYSYRERLGDYEIEVTFASLGELLAHLEKVDRQKRES